MLLLMFMVTVVYSWWGVTLLLPSAAFIVTLYGGRFHTEGLVSREHFKTALIFCFVADLDF